MVRRGHVRRVFPGGNTSRGFYSFYDHIAPNDDGYSFVLKGGPGTGKSTFIRQIADELIAQGVEAEFHHCSADASSIDAVVFGDSGLCIVDGTAPHVYEPRHYNVDGEIVDLSPFLDAKAVKRHEKAIRLITADAKAAFQRAYRYLAAARHVREDWAASRQAAGGDTCLPQRAASFVEQIFHPPPAPSDIPRGDVGHARRLFASSITPDGPLHHLDTLLAPLKRIFIVNGQTGTGRERLLEMIGQAALIRGYDTQFFHCAFEPKHIDHVIIPALSTAVLSSEPPHTFPDERQDRRIAGRIDLNDGASKHALQRNGPHIDLARQTFWQLFRHAVTALKDAQRLHMQLESLYVPAMDFAGLQRLHQRIRQKIYDRLDAITSR